MQLRSFAFVVAGAVSICLAGFESFAEESFEKIVLKGHPSWVLCVAFSPDGRTLASGGREKAIKLWSVAGDRQPIALEGNKDIFSLAFSPDGRLLAAADGDGTVKVWDLRSRPPQRVHVLKGHKGIVTCVVFSPDGKMLASAGEDTTVRLWDPSTGREEAVLKRTPLDFGRDGVRALAVSPNGKTLVAAQNDGTIAFWDRETKKERLSVRPDKRAVDCAQFSPDGKLLATADYGDSDRPDSYVRFWNPTCGTEKFRITMRATAETNSVIALAFMPDGKTLISARANHTIKLWDVATLTETRTLKGHTGMVSSLSLSPDGKTLASGSLDRTVRLWDISAANEQKE
jgi:WD40 repeat protein